jgi:hypothetical protein
MVTKIEGIGNHYGSLHIKEKEGKHFMKVYCELYRIEWREISKELYDMLLELNSKQNKTP